jgi:CheY-like chemotaxis protein
MSGNPATSSVSNVAGPWRVLLVTGSLVEQKLLVGLLTKHQHRVFVAGNGREALLEWSENEFDVVLLDALLPETDGPELAHEIRELENGSMGPLLSGRGRCLPVPPAADR